MNPAELWTRAEDLFHRTRGRSQEEQAAILDTRHNDPELVAMVREMLAEIRVGDDEDCESPREEVESVPARIGGYEIVREIGRGGMGIVYEARQPRLNRPIALKILRPEYSGDDAEAHERLQWRARRFLDEAEVLGQLDHPGIVPILELGEDDDGIAFFTMRLVTGEDFRVILAKVRSEVDGWNVSRALSVLQRVCETLAFAHHRGIVHRDLKPSNLMVGKFGEVYLIDWGLARVVGRSPGPGSGSEATQTIEGDVVGTPAYMSPEQALGQLDRIGPKSDVYSLGAILYELLTGCSPYWDPLGRNSAYELLERVRRGAPPTLASRRSVPPMLAAICDKAMAHEIHNRYATVDALGSDLRAFLSNHVVEAYERGPVAELRMWCVRNRSLAWALALAFAAAVVGAIVLGVMNRALTRTNDAVFRLSATRELETLLAEVDGLWPATLDRAQAMEGWLRRADALIADLPIHVKRRDELRAHALPWTADEQKHDRATSPARAALEQARQRLESLTAMPRAIKPHIVENATLDSDIARNEQFRLAIERIHREIEALNVEIPTLERITAERRTWRFASRDDGWWHEQLDHLVRDLEAIAAPLTGVRDGISPEYGLGVARRLELARTTADLTVESPRSREQWRAAISSIADLTECPAYSGMIIAPQLGLLPLGRDPTTGLHEFWHPASGKEPARDAKGGVEMNEAMSLVFVLIPAGSFDMGAQARYPAAANYDPHAQIDEEPVHRAEVGAFLISKYEMTRAQWARIVGRDPSVNSDPSGSDNAGLLPVENVPFDHAYTWCERLGLALPSETQWEYSCRAGTTTPWWCGADVADLDGRANLADIRFADVQHSTSAPIDASLDDGFGVESPIGSFPANRFGLHDTIGNVHEWCANPWTHVGYGVDTDASPELRSKLAHVTRGGSYGSLPNEARSADRLPVTPISQSGLMFNGLRPVRLLDPAPTFPTPTESK